MYLENNQSRKISFGPIIAWFLVFIWMIVIFALSAQDGTQSGRLSGGIAAAIYPLLFSNTSPEGLAVFEGQIRNLAHGAIYFILALLTSFAILKSRIRDIRNMILTLIICAIYAATDEFHQVFVPGRASEWSDYFINIVGSLIGILLFHLIGILIYFRRLRKGKGEQLVVRD